MSRFGLTYVSHDLGPNCLHMTDVATSELNRARFAFVTPECSDELPEHPLLANYAMVQSHGLA